MTTIWIAPWGNDDNPGTKRLPKLTIQAAAAALPRTGGTVRLHKGHYGPFDLASLPDLVNIVGTRSRPRPVIELEP